MIFILIGSCREIEIAVRDVCLAGLSLLDPVTVAWFSCSENLVSIWLRN